MERKRDTSKKKRTIMDAAIQAFQESGYENTSMDYIAEIAGASKRTVYNHFSSKEQLFEEILQQFAEETAQLKEIEYSPDRSLESQLTDFSMAKIKIASHPKWLPLMRVVMGVFLFQPKLAAETVLKFKSSEDSLVGWLKNAHEDKRLNIPEPQLAADLFWSMVSGAFFWPTIFYDYKDEDQVKILQNEIVKTFIARYRFE